MKVLSIVKVTPNKFGSFEKYCIEFTQYLKKNGHGHVIVFESEPTERVLSELESAGAIVLVKAFKKFGISECLYIVQCIKKYEISVVHMHFYKIYSLFSLLMMFSKAKYFITYHISGAPAESSSLKRLLKIVRRVILGAGITKVFCVSKYNRDRFVSDFAFPIEKTEVVYNGVNQDYYSNLRKEISKPESDLVNFISVGYMIPEKGLNILIKASRVLLEKGIKHQISLVGDGPSKNSLEKLAIELGVDGSVNFLGSRNDVPSLLIQSDVAVVPSIWQEACAYTVIEAMSAGLPIIATRVGGNPELVTRGIIVEPSSEHELASAMKDLIEDSGLRDKFAKENTAHAKSAFDINRVFNQQCEAYQYS